jgi:hypothetical protein
VYEVGAWDDNLLIEDLDLNLRIGMKYKVDFVPKPLIYYRRHTSSFLSNYKLMLKGFEQYYEKYKNNKQLSIDRWMSDTYKLLSYEALDHKDYALSLKLLRQSFKFYQSINFINTVGVFIRRYFSGIKVLRKIWFSTKSILKDTPAVSKDGLIK